MLQIVNFILNLFILLPWWAAVAVIVALGGGLWLTVKYLMYKMHRDVCEAVANEGAAMATAQATVHSVKPAPAPTDRSVYDAHDEDYDPEVDDYDPAELGAYYQVEATIDPGEPATTWDPTALSL